MKSTSSTLEKRGYVTPGTLKKYQAFTTPALLNLLESPQPSERTAAVKILDKLQLLLAEVESTVLKQEITRSISRITTRSIGAFNSPRTNK